jgi:DNA-binding NtrC family response regulator
MAVSSQNIDEDDYMPPVVREAERFQMIRAMARSGGDLDAVSAILGLPPEEIILKMRSFGLDPIDYQAPLEDFRPREPGQTTVPTVY